MRTIANVVKSLLAVGLFAGALAATVTVSNPFLHADIPDPSILRVGDAYYMSHTTMHMAPGVPIMKSTDLVNWKTVSYCYNTLASSDAMNLNNGASAYGKGSWASSIRYKNGTFYVLVPSYTTGKTHLYSTTTPEKTPWKEIAQLPFYHDPSLWLDDNGNNYVVYGSGDIKIVQLNSTLTAVQSGGTSATLVSSSTIKTLLGVSSPILVGEGAHIEKVGNYYHILVISWPNAAGYDGRTELDFRSTSLTGTYSGKVVHSSKGVAQGSVLQDSKGKWWGYLFQDAGAVGRCPWIMPVTWASDWPSFNGGISPTSLTMTTNSAAGTGIVSSDNFDSAGMRLEWQWNHNPDNSNWSLSKRPGYYRITTSRVDASLRKAKNTLTQRSFGPKCSGRVALDASGLKNGDIAGLAAFQDTMGFVGVKNSNGSLSIVKYKGTVQEASASISQTRVYLRIDMDFTNRTDKATFYYSLDSTNWKPIGNTLQMTYTLGMFMGYRFALFNYATASAGGYADFDWFKIGSSVSESIDMYPQGTPVAVAARAAETRKGLSCRFGPKTSSIEVAGEVPAAGRLEITLHDSKGRLVSRLADRQVETGSFNLAVPAGPLPEGRYVMVGRLDGILLESRSLVLVR